MILKPATNKAGTKIIILKIASKDDLLLKNKYHFHSTIFSLIDSLLGGFFILSLISLLF